MTNEKAIAILRNQHRWTGEPEKINEVRAENEALEMAIEALKEPCEQIKWERDTALAQLKELGYGLGEKIQPIDTLKIDGMLEDAYEHGYEQARHDFETQPCGDADNNYPLNMPTEAYRLRMIRAFHNADCDELIALVVMPTEKEFEQLEGLLKTHYKKQPCEDAVSREHLLSEIDKLMQSPWFNNGKDDRAIPHYGYVERKEAVEIVRDLCVKTEPPATPKPKTGKWIKVVTETDSFGNETYHHECSVCRCNKSGWGEYRFCPNCGAKMEGESK